MISLTLLALVLILAVVLVARLRTTRPLRAGPRVGRRAAGPPELDPRLHRWVEAGLISPEESAAIAAYEAGEAATVVGGEVGPPEPPSPPAAPPVAAPEPVRHLRSDRVPIVAEVLGYLGAALATAGVLLVVSRFWTDLAASGRVALAGGAALALGLAGLAVHERVDPALARLRAVFWLASTAAATLAAGVVADVLADSPAPIIGTVATTAAVVSGAMWAGRDRPAQQLVALAAVPVAVAGWVAMTDSVLAVGVAVWLVGAALFAVGVRLRTPAPWIAETVGAVALLVGSIDIATAIEGLGLFTILATGVGLLAVALVRGLAPSFAGQLIAGVFGVVTVLQSGPPLLGWYAEQAGVVTGLTLWLAGGAVLALGWAARTRLPEVLEAAGALMAVAGAAVCGVQAPGFAALFGVANALALLGLGLRPGRVILSAVGALALVVNVPWAIAWFFPGEGTAPLLIMVAGLLIIGAAVLLTRLGDRFERELGHPHPA